MGKDPGKIDSFLRPAALNRKEPAAGATEPESYRLRLAHDAQAPAEAARPVQSEVRRPTGIESLISEVARYYEEQITVLNRELSALRNAAAADLQRQTVLLQDQTRLQAALTESERQRKRLKVQLDQAEQRIDALANLYLAAFTLHRQHDWHTVLRALTEILINQIGAESFTVALCQPAGTVQIIIQHGVEDSLPAAEALTAFWEQDQPQYNTAGTLALVPLTTPDGPLGLISLSAMLPQKGTLTADDRKLLTVLSCLAATALEAAQQRDQKTAQFLPDLTSALAEIHHERLQLETPAEEAPEVAAGVATAEAAPTELATGSISIAPEAQPEVMTASETTASDESPHAPPEPAETAPASRRLDYGSLLSGASLAETAVNLPWRPLAKRKPAPPEASEPVQPAESSAAESSTSVVSSGESSAAKIDYFNFMIRRRKASAASQPAAESTEATEPPATSDKD